LHFPIDFILKTAVKRAVFSSVSSATGASIEEFAEAFAKIY
jgi:hypothetical protein